MRPDAIFRQARVWRRGSTPPGSAWRRHRLGRPFVAGLVLLAVGGALKTGQSLLDRGDGAALGSGSGWPTAVAGDLSEPRFGRVLVLPGEREAATDRELEAALARLKEGAFGVAFEPLVAGAETGAGRHAEPARPDPAATAPAAAEARFEPVVQIDAAQPPLRLEIMGLAAVSTRATPSERQQGRMAETAP